MLRQHTVFVYLQLLPVNSAAFSSSFSILSSRTPSATAQEVPAARRVHGSLPSGRGPHAALTPRRRCVPAPGTVPPLDVFSDPSQLQGSRSSRYQGRAVSEGRVGVNHVEGREPAGDTSLPRA